MNAAPPPARERWPFQVKYILGNEAAERFSYYGMKGILALYITNVLLMTKDQSTHIIHLFGFANYFMPLVGAWVSDRFLGRYKTILWISLSYCVGHGVMALSDVTTTIDGKTMCLYIGLALIAFGSGGIKPCVSAFMGDQFKPEQRHLLQKAYAAFYWSINLGSTASFLIIPWVARKHGYAWAFGIPGLAMAFATFVFWLGTKHYVMVPPARTTRTAGFLQVLSFTTAKFLKAWLNREQPRQPFWDAARTKFREDEIDAARSVLPILSIFALAPIFWSLFDQTFSTWILQGEQMVPYQLGDFTIGPEAMLTANPILVMIFLPILTWGVYPMLGKWATPLRRMSAGMFLAGGSFIVVAMMQTRIDQEGAQLSVLWQIVPYIIITIAEVLFSTTGLEFAFREAAPSMKSTILGFWNLTVALGNLLVSVLTSVLAVGDSGSESVSAGRFMLYAAMTFGVAVVFAIVASFYKYRDPSAALGK
ncbi:MAG TPA: MFS transporter [Verrucomicrobiae bacterium]|nr:MFS transporter [Verrucomicrobiae bacterium]